MDLILCHFNSLTSAHHRSSAELLLPGSRTEFALLFQVVTLLELLLPGVAAENGGAVLVNAIAEVLTGHANTGSFPALNLPFVNEIPLLQTHASSTLVLLQVARAGQSANGSALPFRLFARRPWCRGFRVVVGVLGSRQQL